jgi:hypothetical protein
VIEIDTYSFQLIVHDVAGVDNGREKKASIELKRRDRKDSEFGTDYSYLHKRKLDAQIDRPTEISMQAGDYDLTVKAAAAARDTRPITVSAGMGPLEVQLQRGSDLHYELIRPDGERRVPAALQKDGHDVPDEYYDTETRRFRGLPVGKYVLHVPRSKAVQRKDDYYFSGFAPAKIPYAGRDIPFAITADSPPVVDLGTIYLKAERK